MDITAAQSTIKNVVDLYYSWLIDMIGPKGKDKIALLSTIVTHDIDKAAPLYSNYIFRQFADRTISVSPEDFGAGNTTDRYSRIYRNVIETAASELYAKGELTGPQTDQLNSYSGEITAAVTEIKNIRKLSNSEWRAYAKEVSIPPNTPQWDLEQAKFYQPYIALIRDQRDRIVRAQSKKRAIWLSVFKDDPEGKALANIYERTIAEDSMQALPSDLITEQKYGLDPVNIGMAADSGIYAFEKELGILPSGTLTKILEMSGVRGATFEHNVVETHNHDSEWHTSGSGGWGLWSASASAQQENHFRQSLSNLENISISCDYLGEYWVNRKDWFSSTILKNKYVVEVLANDVQSAALLANCIASLIIVRGLKVTYKFKNVADTEVWSSYAYSGGGGYGAFGINFGKVSGGGSGNQYDHVIDTAERSVTFSDGANVCRVLAMRVSPVLDVPLEEIAFAIKPLEDSLLGQQVLEAWRTGAVPFGEVPQNNN